MTARATQANTAIATTNAILMALINASAVAIDAAKRESKLARMSTLDEARAPMAAERTEYTTRTNPIAARSATSIKSLFQTNTNNPEKFSTPAKTVVQANTPAA